MKKILYHGFYGFRNSGDDAFVEVCAWGGRKYWNTTRNIFLSGNLPKLINPAGMIREYKIRPLNRIPISLLASKADSFVCAGGSLFTKCSGSSVINNVLKIREFLNGKMRVGAIGVSVGPFECVKDENDVKKCLQAIDFLALRDRRSYEYVLSLNLPYKPVRAFDLAALLPQVYEGIDDRLKVNAVGRKIIGVSVCNYESYARPGAMNRERRRNKYLLELLSNIPDKPDIMLRFFVFNGHPLIGDEKITDEFINYLSDKFRIEKIPYPGNVHETWNKISECDLVISTRLHASVFACYAGVPFFLMEYHQKCTDFVEDIGHCSPYRLFDGERLIGEVTGEIRKILFDGAYTPPSNVRQTIILSGNNFLECNKN